MIKNSKIKKIIMSILAIFTLISNCLCGYNFSYAANNLDSAYLYSKGSRKDLLKYNGRPITITYVAYNNNGSEYPAYCLDVEKPGVGENGNYSVTPDEAISDVIVWRAITNGFPYRTYQELGCANEEEAFAATKQAVYCVLYDSDEDNFSRFEAIGEAGQRTLNALKNIVTKARNSNLTPSSAILKIATNNINWKIDEKNNKNVSKEFWIESESVYSTYTVNLEGTYPTDTKIVDINNKIKTTFSKGEKFKILLPVNSLVNSGTIKINVEAKTDSKIVLYGKAPNDDVQNYALTTLENEVTKGSKEITYEKNASSITILKQDSVTKKPMKGVEFKILDENKNIVYKNLLTDQNGKIVMDNMKPGKYYIQETQTLEGYNLYTKLMEVNLEYNEDFIATINNTKEDKTEDIKITGSVEVIEDLEEHTTIIKDKNNTESYNTTINTNNLINQNSQKKEEVNINNNSNESKNEQTTIIKNENDNENLNNNNQNTNISNENNNNNANINNQNTTINNKNENQNIDINKQDTINNNKNSNLDVNINYENNKTENNDANININKDVIDVAITNKTKNENINAIIKKIINKSILDNINIDKINEQILKIDYYKIINLKDKIEKDIILSNKIIEVMTNSIKQKEEITNNIENNLNLEDIEVLNAIKDAIIENNNNISIIGNGNIVNKDINGNIEINQNGKNQTNNIETDSETKININSSETINNNESEEIKNVKDLSNNDNIKIDTDKVVTINIGGQNLKLPKTGM